MARHLAAILFRFARAVASISTSWSSESLRPTTTLFLLRVHFTGRIHFPIQVSPQPSRSQRSNQTESAIRPRRCAYGLIAARVVLVETDRRRLSDTARIM